MNARDDILSGIRRSLCITGREASRIRSVDERLAAAPQGVIPQRGQLPPSERVMLFCRQALAAKASIETIAALNRVPQAVAQFLGENAQPTIVRLGADPVLSALAWGQASLTVSHGVSRSDDPVTITRAVGGIAESGTLAFLSGPDNPPSLNILPDNHIAVLQARDIYGDYETLWEKVRATFGKGVLPRAVTLVTGPSRSADIEQTLQLGAHGPKRLHILLVEE